VRVRLNPIGAEVASSRKNLGRGSLGGPPHLSVG